MKLIFSILFSLICISCSTTQKSSDGNKTTQSTHSTQTSSPSQQVQEAVTEKNKSFHITDYTHAVGFLTYGFDSLPHYDKKKFCSIEHEDLSLHLMLLKSLIDQQVNQIQMSVSQNMINSKELALNCHKTCSCQIYEEIQNRIDSKQLTLNSKQQIEFSANLKLALANYKKQSNKACYKTNKDFCQSDLYKQLAQLFSENNSK